MRVKYHLMKASITSPRQTMLKFQTSELKCLWAAIDLCEKIFGPSNQTKLTASGRGVNNHGKWERNNYKIAFRYEADLTLFLLTYQGT